MSGASRCRLLNTKGGRSALDNGVLIYAIAPHIDRNTTISKALDEIRLCASSGSLVMRDFLEEMDRDFDEDYVITHNPDNQECFEKFIRMLAEQAFDEVPNKSRSAFQGQAI